RALWATRRVGARRVRVAARIALTRDGSCARRLRTAARRRAATAASSAAGCVATRAAVARRVGAVFRDDVVDARRERDDRREERAEWSEHSGRLDGLNDSLPRWHQAAYLFALSRDVLPLHPARRWFVPISARRVPRTVATPKPRNQSATAPMRRGAPRHV